MASERLIGNKPNQVPLNAMLGRLAFLDAPIHNGSDTPGQRPADGDVTPGEIWLNRGDGRQYTKAGNSIIDLGPIYRWGELPIGSQTIGTPGGLNFGTSDPPINQLQYDTVIYPIYKHINESNQALDARLADLEQKVAILYSLYLWERSMQTSGVSIGVPGTINFGAGAAIPTGVPSGLGEDAYYPVDTASNSLM